MDTRRKPSPPVVFMILCSMILCSMILLRRLADALDGRRAVEEVVDDLFREVFGARSGAGADDGAHAAEEHEHRRFRMMHGELAAGLAVLEDVLDDARPLGPHLLPGKTLA